MSAEQTNERIPSAAEAEAAIPLRLAKVQLRILSQHVCPFFSDRQATMLGAYALKKYGRYFSDLLEQGYWRRTDVIEKPVCRDCKACKSIRIPVREFAMSRSQMRVWKRNADVKVEVVDYAIEPVMLDLIQRYLVGRHNWGKRATEDRLDQVVEWYAQRLGRSPVKCRAFKYWLDGKLVGISVCDDCKGALYSAFFAYDLEFKNRGLGNYSILHEIDWCRREGKTHYYMANMIAGFEPSHYKMRFKPFEIRGEDGIWQGS